MRIVAAFVIAAALATSGCDRIADLDLPFLGDGAGDQSAAAASGASEGASPMAEPGTVRRSWMPADSRTRDVTGKLTSSLPEGRAGPLVLAYANGLTYQLSPLGIQLGADEAGVSGDAAFTEILGVPGDGGVFLYRVASERVDSIAPQGGLCGRDPASFLAISEFVDGSGEWSLTIAAFRGAVAPGPGAPTDPALCGTYMFRVA